MPFWNQLLLFSEKWLWKFKNKHTLKGLRIPLSPWVHFPKWQGVPETWTQPYCSGSRNPRQKTTTSWSAMIAHDPRITVFYTFELIFCGFLPSESPETMASTIYSSSFRSELLEEIRVIHLWLWVFHVSQHRFVHKNCHEWEITSLGSFPVTLPRWWFTKRIQWPPKIQKCF